jgi:hypothetical protein
MFQDQSDFCRTKLAKMRDLQLKAREVLALCLIICQLPKTKGSDPKIKNKVKALIVRKQKRVANKRIALMAVTSINRLLSELVQHGPFLFNELPTTWNSVLEALQIATKKIPLGKLSIFNL